MPPQLTDQPQDDAPLVPARRPARPRLVPVHQVIVIALGSTLLGWIVSPGPVARDALSRPAISVALAMAGGALAISCWAWIRHLRRWVFPLRRAHVLLRRAHAGKAPIESFSQIRGPLRPLAQQVQHVLRDLRQQQAAVGQLALELEQRVAHRTDALERKLGSLRVQATLDPLTLLQNRRALDQALNGLIQHEHAQQRPADERDLSLLMIDIDNFKLLNDALGHAAGDAFLKSIGQLIRSAIRPNDQAFRMGGDELLIVLPDCEPSAAAHVRDRLVSLADALARPLKLPHPPRLSIGLASLSETPHATPEQRAAELLSLADQRLYSIKAGRHRRPPPSRSTAAA
jgi:diguanylate cyclase (GGDEF)-like protein